MTNCKVSVTVSPTINMPSIAEVALNKASAVAALKATVTSEVISPVAAPRLFQALVVHSHDLIPKVAPKVVQNYQIIEGNGGPGTIKRVDFPQDSQSKFAMLKVDELDTTDMTYRYTVVEGDALTDKHEKIAYEMKLEARPEGGTTVRNVGTYHTKPGVEIKDEDVMKEGEEKVVAVFKAVEAYLIANPNEFS